MTFTLILSSLPVILALMGASDTFVLARRPPAPTAPLPPDLATMMVEVRLALCEPLLSIGALLVAIIAGLPAGAAQAVALGSLVWIVGLPWRGRPLQDPAMRAVRSRLLWLNFARWATLLAPAAILPAIWAPLAVVGAVLMWRTTIWGKDLLTNVLVLPPPPRARPASLVVSAPRVAPPQPITLSPEEALLRSLPPGPELPCVSCGTVIPLNVAVCEQCGLLFASRVPAALRPLADSGYHVLRPLGAGGMSAVYLAYDRTAASWCSVKTVVSVDAQGDVVWRRQASESLAREASVLVELEHPHIVRVINWLDDAAAPALVLDLVPGVSLDQYLHDRGGAPLAVADVLALGRALTGVLGYLAAQEQPVAHSDIKPGNILVGRDLARPTLVDFGAAARLPAGGTMLAPHSAFGTPGYAAPEQYRGEVGVASDIYGLGATLYHLLTGDDPAQHPTQFPALVAVPPTLQELLAAALSPDPLRRPTAAEFGAGLDLRT